jgi:transmembrane protein 33
MWFFTTPVFLSLVPYFIYSVFHVVTYFSEYVLPAITARPARPQEDKLAQLARKYQDAGSQTVAKVEVYGILLRLLVGIILYVPPSLVFPPSHLSSLKFPFPISPITLAILLAFTLSLYPQISPP